MKFDGSRVQLMVHGEDVKVREVTVNPNEGGRGRVLRITAIISEEQAKGLAESWNASFDGPGKLAFNAGISQDARLDSVRHKNQMLEREIYGVRRQLAKRVLSEVDVSAMNVELEEDEGQ